MRYFGCFSLFFRIREWIIIEIGLSRFITVRSTKCICDGIPSKYDAWELTWIVCPISFFRQLSRATKLVWTRLVSFKRNRNTWLIQLNASVQNRMLHDKIWARILQYRSQFPSQDSKRFQFFSPNYFLYYCYCYLQENQFLDVKFANNQTPISRDKKCKSVAAADAISSCQSCHFRRLLIAIMQERRAIFTTSCRFLPSITLDE